MYLNLIQIAESFGVSEKIVEDWMRNEALPHTHDRGRLIFDRGQVAVWASARGLAAKAGFLAPETSAFSTGWRLEPLLRAGGIWRDLPASGVPGAFQSIIASLPGATPAIRQLLARRLEAAAGIAIAPIGGGFAMPHPSARISLGRDSGMIALLLLREPLAVTEPVPDDVPITRLFFFVAPSPRAHLDFLGRLCRLLGRKHVRELIVGAAADEDIFRAVAAADKSASGTGHGEEPA
jgi:PTS system nitrogen regulatory IIA component